jgi:hypothetical protein
MGMGVGVGLQGPQPHACTSRDTYVAFASQGSTGHWLAVRAQYAGLRHVVGMVPVDVMHSLRGAATGTTSTRASCGEPGSVKGACKGDRRECT